MSMIFVSPDFPLNRRMRKAVQRGKLQVFREGGERSALGGEIPSGKGRAFKTTGAPFVCMAIGGSEMGGGRNEWEHCGNPKHPSTCRLRWKYPTQCKFCDPPVLVIAYGCDRSAVYFNPWDRGGGAHLHGDDGGGDGGGDTYWEMLKRAASMGDVDAINHIAKMPNVFSRVINKADEHGRAPLFFAVMHDQPETIDTLFKHGGCTGHLDNDGRTLMQYAVHVKSPSAIHTLVKLDMDVNEIDSAGKTLLYLAVEGADQGPTKPVRNRENVIKALLDNEADINKTNACSKIKGCIGRGCSPIVFAAMRNRWELVAVMAQRRANLEAKNCYGYTPMHWAAWHNNDEAIAMLVENGANINPKDGYNQTPLDLATCKRNHRAANELKRHGGKSKKEL